MSLIHGENQLLHGFGADVNTEYIIGKINDGGVLKDLYYTKFEITVTASVGVVNVPFTTLPTKFIKCNTYIATGNTYVLGTNAPSQESNSSWWVSVGKIQGLTIDNKGTQSGMVYYAEVEYVVS